MQGAKDVVLVGSVVPGNQTMVSHMQGMCLNLCSISSIFLPLPTLVLSHLWLCWLSSSRLQVISGHTAAKSMQAEQLVGATPLSTANK